MSSNGGELLLPALKKKKDNQILLIFEGIINKHAQNTSNK